MVRYRCVHVHREALDRAAMTSVRPERPERAETLGIGELALVAVRDPVPKGHGRVETPEARAPMTPPVDGGAEPHAQATEVLPKSARVRVASVQTPVPRRDFRELAGHDRLLAEPVEGLVMQGAGEACGRS
jgi:hypothetical protein